MSVTASAIIDGLGGNHSNGMCQCPAHDDRKASLHVVEGDNGKVLVKCFAKCSQTDVIDALKARGLWGKAHKPNCKANGATRPPLTTSERTERADAIWRAAKAGDPQSVEYLQKRGIKKTPSCARLLTIRAAKGLDRAIGVAATPSLVWPIHRDGKHVGVHVISLNRDGTRKFDNDKAKKSYGPIKGGYVPLANADPDKPLLIGEGIETVLSAMQITGLPGIATTGTNFLEAVEPPKASEYIIAGDSDDAGHKAASKLATGLRFAGHRVRIVAPDGVKDWNDALQTKGADVAELKARLLQPVAAPATTGGALPRKAKSPDWVKAKADAAEARSAGQDPHDAKRKLVDAAGEPVEAPAALSEADAKLIARLAGLSPLDYERERKEVAEDLGVRAPVIDELVRERRTVVAALEAGADPMAKAPWETDIEPWGKRVDGARLLSDIYDTVTRHISMTHNAAMATSLWVLHSWCLDAADHNPFLRVWSPVKGCGKSTLLKVLGRLVPRALTSANLTSATAFRIIEANRPTLLIDEADTFFHDNPDLRGIINSAHDREIARVMRMGGENKDIVQTFSTWAPLALSGIGKLHATLEDRSLPVELQRQRVGKEKEQLPRDPKAYLKLARRCAAFGRDHVKALRKATPKIPPELRNRARDNWWPLLAIAEACGPEWATLARETAVQVTRKAALEDEDPRIMLLTDIRDMLALLPDDEYLPSSHIVKELAELESRPWAEWRRGRPISQSALAKLLKPFKVVPTRIRGSMKRAQSYKRSTLQKAFDAYVGPDRKRSTR